jgi:hypothetical protein
MLPPRPVLSCLGLGASTQLASSALLKRNAGCLLPATLHPVLAACHCAARLLWPEVGAEEAADLAARGTAAVALAAAVPGAIIAAEFCRDAAAVGCLVRRLPAAAPAVVVASAALAGAALAGA